MGDVRNIALLGQPNSGKSTIFNTLTGMHQHVGNWPGKTVEKKEGTFTHKDITYRVADLPGSYSLSANSDEEIVTRDYVARTDLDLVCILADASQLERSLYMLADFAGIKTPVMLVLTMMDVAESKGKKIDVKRLSEKLGIEVCSIVAYDKKTYEPFFQSMEKAISSGKSLIAEPLYENIRRGEAAEAFGTYQEKASRIASARRPKEWIAMKMMEGDEAILRELTIKGEGNISADPKGALYTSDARFKWIESLLDETVVNEKKTSELLTRFDRIAIGPRSGKWVAFGIMVLALAGAMIVASPMMAVGGLLPSLLNPIADMLGNAGVSEGIIHFIKATLITSLGWVISMVGFIFAMNFVFGILEEVGYMARVSYVFDTSMSRLGLQGKALMPMIMGFGCTMGSTSGARVIDSYGQKVMTIAVSWAIPCGATFVVIPTLANAFFGTGGGMLVMLLIILIMIVHVIITANLFGTKLNPVEKRSGMVMEMPPYHKPRWGFIFKNSLMRMWDVFKKAFSIELVVCILFFFLSYSRAGIEESILYKIGTFIEPVSAFIGLRWQTFMSFFAAMVSKEAVLGVLSAIFANSGSVIDTTTGLAATSDNIAQIVATAIPKPEALAFIIAVTFNIPCLQAVVSTYNETHSAKWTARIGAYYIVTALILAAIVYHVSALFF
ncbi:MAG: ferrous iron transport protein B [Lachnospiraceae bacterium]|nr:ferrous iron transport protein B [Lachnospiraceae bacterium]